MKKSKGRLLIVSNRLPVSLEKKGSALAFFPSSGGLATSLGSFYKNCKYYQKTIWIGWPGAVAKENREEVRKKLDKEFCCHPVFIPESLQEKFYEGFSNNTLWPLFHSFQSYTSYSASEWEAYKKVNLLFSEELAKIAKPADTIWIHDYHLMLLPKYLRERLPTSSIGFFLHIPFPPYDIFRLLPQNKEVISGLLGSDLVGFHTYDYAQAFLVSARRLLGCDSELGRIVIGDRNVLVDVFPIGIDFARFSAAAESKNQRKEFSKIDKKIGSSKKVFSVSRLDYTKGIPQSLEAIEEFFEKYPTWRGLLTYILVIVPSREKVARYAASKREIDEIVGRINSKFGSLDWQPIRYIYRSLDFSELIALYSKADVALITPLRDGMNLIAKEYVATKNDCQGVLILSEMTGAAKELLEALIVNPNSKEDIADALQKALTMNKEEQIKRNKIMRNRLKNYDVKKWAKSFLGKLSEVVSLSNMLSIRSLKPKGKERLLKDFRASKKRLFLLDYDGTLTPFFDRPEDAKPSVGLLKLLRKLAQSSKNRLVIVSGRDKKTLGTWFKGLKATLVGEHGAWFKEGSHASWRKAAELDNEWKKQIRPIMQLFVDRIPGSFIEEKDFSLCWHYRMADVDIGVEAAKEMIDTLTDFTANLDLNVLPGNKVVEVKAGGISKGAFYTHYLAREKWPFILAIGDDWTDEFLFSALPKDSYSIRVGFTPSAARFNLKSSEEVLPLLEELSVYS